MPEDTVEVLIRDKFCFWQGVVLYQTRHSTLYRVKEIKTNNSCLVRLLRSEWSELAGFSSLQREYEICHTLADKSGLFPAPEFLQDPYTAAIVWNESEGIPLSKYLKNTSISIGQFYNIASQMVEGLITIHSAGLIHRNISSETIFIRPSTQEVFLFNFGSAAFWKERANNDVVQGAPVCGTYHYMSPEHTGKLDRPIDYRSDIYSLGIVWYELLSGSVPFEGLTNNMAIMFAQVAVLIPPLHTIKDIQSVPFVLSEIISKMLRKNASDRYQSANGLLYDLQKSKDYLLVSAPSDQVNLSLRMMLHRASMETRSSDQNTEQAEQLQQLKVIQMQQLKIDSRAESPMELGVYDRAPYLQLVHTVIGRDTEIQQIIQQFNRCNSSKRSQLLMIGGYSGIGKR